MPPIVLLPKPPYGRRVSILPAPLRLPDYRAFWAARLLATLAGMMMVIVIGWQVYDIARQTMPPREAAFLLGMIGLVQFLPLLILSLFIGVIADRMDRRHMARIAVAIELGCAAALALMAAVSTVTIPALFVVAALLGVGRAIASPALSALAPNLVPREMLPSAIALNSIAWQVGAIAGPPAGAFLYAVSDVTAYGAAACMFAGALVALFAIRPVPRPPAAATTPLRSLVEGLAYVRQNRIVLGAITLDLFAVILGGATAMLPLYARDILHVGVEGLGPLRAAPAAGAAVVALILAARPLRRHVGVIMFAGVAVFSLATIVFGLSRSMPLSLASLAVLGAADMLSVYVRSSLIQLHTPDEMRGRVSSVAGLFISATNELGEFRSGTTASWFGPVESVVIGGVGALVVTGVWAWGFPALRRADRFEAA